MTVRACRTCGTELLDAARFCHGCGSELVNSDSHAEYKWVTVLFADVVRSMAIAAAVGPERLREIMAELFSRSSAVVRRYGGTVDKFTGDGIMAVFGAPLALEDHAFRACLAASAIQQESQVLSREVEDHDGVTLQLRVGLNSGAVIAGEIGSQPRSYTTVGEQVGIAQRLESVAPPGGVLLSESTARLAQDTVTLAPPVILTVKDADAPVVARRLLTIEGHRVRDRGEPVLVGRTRELAFLTAILDETIGGSGSVVNVVGPAGIGKSRLVRELAAIAIRRNVAVFTSSCESHASDIPFYGISRLLRRGMGIDAVDGDDAARLRVRQRFTEGDDDDLLLLDDLLGIADPSAPLPDIAPEARRRRLTAMINASALAQTQPAVYIVEDVHWIDAVSESMLCDFLAVMPQTPSLVLITFRPEYRGALTRVSGAQTIALRPLTEAQATTLATGLLGEDPSLTDLASKVSIRAAGNPFFIEEIVRDLTERGVLEGAGGAYSLRGGVADDIDVPATLYATIGARIDRLSSTAKSTLNAAAVIGSRFDAELLTRVVDGADVDPLIEAELVDQVRFGRPAEFAFRHPLIRAVAYESQLRSVRVQLHRRIAEVIESRDPAAADEHAALIAEHREAAGDFLAAYTWHMQAGDWLAKRDITGARNSWRRARQVADRLPDSVEGRLSMRITPRAFLCGTAFRVGGGGAETGFDELRELCVAARDTRSLAIGMNGLATVHLFDARRREACRLADELADLLDSIGDRTLTIAMLPGVATVKHEVGEMEQVLQLAQRVLDLADDDPRRGDRFMGSPATLALAMRGEARMCLGLGGWKEDLSTAMDSARAFDPLTQEAVAYYAYVLAVLYGALLPDATILRDTADILARAEQSGDDVTLFGAEAVRSVVLIQLSGVEREAGFEMLAKVRERGLRNRFSSLSLPITDIPIARERVGAWDFDGAVELSRDLLESLYDSGGSVWCALATVALVEALIARGGDQDLEEAREAISRLELFSTDRRLVLDELALLRLNALLARACGDAASYRRWRDCYLVRARVLGFEGQLALAEAMP